MDKDDFVFKKLIKLIGFFFIKEEVEKEMVEIGVIFFEDVG